MQVCDLTRQIHTNTYSTMGMEGGGEKWGWEGRWRGRERERGRGRGRGRRDRDREVDVDFRVKKVFLQIGMID